MIMAGSGLFSGLAGLLWSKEELSLRSLAKYMLLSVVAPFTVPLFLQTLSSNLLEYKPVAGSTDDLAGSENRLLVFGGLCLLAGFYASTYLQRLSARILDKLNDAEHKLNSLDRRTGETSRKLNAVVAPFEEPGEGAEEPD